jgi:hypothetical protein
MEIGSCPKEKRNDPCGLCGKHIKDPKFCTIIRDNTEELLADNEILEIYCSNCTLQVFGILFFSANWDDEPREKKHLEN